MSGERKDVAPLPGLPAAPLFEIEDLWGNTVRLTGDRWDHICLHREMVGLQELVADVVRAPTQVSTALAKDVRYIFDGHNRLPSSDRIVRVVVEYRDPAIKQGSTTGAIVTAYGPLKSNTGGLGNLIYFAGTNWKTR